MTFGLFVFAAVLEIAGCYTMGNDALGVGLLNNSNGNTQFIWPAFVLVRQF